jgi:hypothetical protein
MAKKTSKTKGLMSAGIHSNVSQSTRNAMRAAYVATGDQVMAKLDAFRKGKQVMVTIPNPNKDETNKRFIRVTAKEAGWKVLPR